MNDTKKLVDKLNEMAVYWSGDDYETCGEAAIKLEELQKEIYALKEDLKSSVLMPEAPTAKIINEIVGHNYTPEETMALATLEQNKYGINVIAAWYESENAAAIYRRIYNFLKQGAA